MSQDPERQVVFAGTTMEADLLRIHLQEHGIDARLENETAGTWLPYAAATAGVGAVQVNVPTADVEQARELMQRFHDHD